MTDRQLLEQIFSKVTTIDGRLENVEGKIEKIETRLGNVETRLENVETRLENVETRLENVEQTVTRNYDLTLEFYGDQKEFNAHISDKISNIIARQEIFENQTIKNTAMLQLIK